MEVLLLDVNSNPYNFDSFYESIGDLNKEKVNSEGHGNGQAEHIYDPVANDPAFFGAQNTRQSENEYDTVATETR